METYEMKIDKKLLKKQINAVLESSMPEDTKTGLHNLLGEIRDHLELKEFSFTWKEYHGFQVKAKDENEAWEIFL